MKQTTTSLKAFVFSSAMLASTGAFALPALQIGIEDGTYDMASEDSVTSATAFTLYALADTGIVDAGLFDFRLSIAVTPKLSTPTDLGSIVVNGITIDITDDMTYGTPPVEVVSSSADLPGHGIYDTYYYEVDFSFDTGNKATPYNVQDDPDGFALYGGSGDYLYYNAFDFDVSGFTGTGLHFDLYAFDFDLKKPIVAFAPFSHDGSYNRREVPEPETLALFGVALAGLLVFRRRQA
ncbi:choice-of-anchor N protein [Hahella sp. CR1]|uniref:choice-of-anchor N protein n=1 Tax=Hahella sp. CR1 TaxID=2992807 RepID=UPI0024416EC4|nr:choice-of-anchor N protein [Hahella sp. CR1]MDG9666855.1 choice-of-anchor N protein [Hahella sp. CR1]